MGIAPTLKLKKREKHGTFLGGCVSIMMVCITTFLIFTAYMNTFVKIDWDVKQEDDYLTIENTEAYDIPLKRFMPAYLPILYNEDETPAINETLGDYFDMKFH
jgi:hypothetical protein